MKARSLNQALSDYRAERAIPEVDAGAAELKQIRARFPRRSWPSMTLEQYALGRENSKDTFCYWIEFGTPNCGSIRGGSAHKHLIFKRKNEPGWYFGEQYADERAAWDAVRNAFVRAFDLAEEESWEAIEDLEPLQGGPAMRSKALYVYFPDKLLPVTRRITCATSCRSWVVPKPSRRSSARSG